MTGEENTPDSSANVASATIREKRGDFSTGHDAPIDNSSFLGTDVSLNDSDLTTTSLLEDDSFLASGLRDFYINDSQSPGEGVIRNAWENVKGSQVGNSTENDLLSANNLSPNFQDFHCSSTEEEQGNAENDSNHGNKHIKEPGNSVDAVMNFLIKNSTACDYISPKNFTDDPSMCVDNGSVESPKENVSVKSDSSDVSPTMLVAQERSIDIQVVAQREQVHFPSPSDNLSSASLTSVDLPEMCADACNAATTCNSDGEFLRNDISTYPETLAAPPEVIQSSTPTLELMSWDQSPDEPSILEADGN